MDKFQTNAAGNIDSGTEVLANNLTFMQNGMETIHSQIIQDMFSGNIQSNVFTGGILNTTNPATMFNVTKNSLNNQHFDISLGVAYQFDVNTNLYKRIAITNLETYSNLAPGEDSTLPNGTGSKQITSNGINNVATPKNTGCLDIALPNENVEYYIDLRYNLICDNGNTGTGQGLKNYSIAKKINPSANDEKRFYQWVDGYEIVLVPINDPNEQVLGICLGTVKVVTGQPITITTNGRSNNIVIKATLISDYFLSGEGGLIIETDPQTNKMIISVNRNTIFTVNSGPKEFLSIDNDQHTIRLDASVNTKPLVMTNAYSERLTINSTNNIGYIDIRDSVENIYSDEDGTYNLFINNTNKEEDNIKLNQPIFELMRKIYYGSTEPQSPLLGDVWLDISEEPYIVKWYDGSQWLKYYGIPLVELTVTSGLIESLLYLTRNIEYKNSFAIEKNLSIGNSYDSLGYIQLFGGNDNYGGYIDFHYQNAQAENYTSRIIEDNFKQLNLIAEKGIKINDTPLIYIVEYKTEGNSWYRLWSNGWVEQGGYVQRTSGSQTVSLVVSMFDTDYSCYACYGGINIDQGETNKNIGAVATSQTEITIISQAGVSNPNRIYWEVKGISSVATSSQLVSLTDIDNGASIVNSLWTYTLPENKTLKIDIGGACGLDTTVGNRTILGGGKISCTKQFNAGDEIEIKSINNSQAITDSLHPGIAVAIYCKYNGDANSTLILVAGGGGYIWEYAPYYNISGSGYNGGKLAYYEGQSSSAIYKSGYSIDGTNGTFDGTGGIAKGSSRSNGLIGVNHVFGGNGYVHSDYSSLAITEDGSETRGNKGNAYAIITEIL